MDNITIKAYGKLNLYLDITGKREDGYHLLRSVMQSVSVFDTLTFELCSGEGIEIICDSQGFPLDSRNLIWKAAELFYNETALAPRGKLRVTVDKNIPSMAGMAGGSADGAAALTALNRLYGDLLDRDKLRILGAKLGADVPFTLFGGTMLCEGIGEKLTELNGVKDIYFAVIRPDINISTPAAYKSYDSRMCSTAAIKKKSYPAFQEALMLGEAQQIADGMFNALEAAVDAPEIKEAKEKLLTYGALGAMMTGSGSVVFGVFDSEDAAKSCIEKMHGYPFAAVLEPVDCGLEILR